MYRRLFWAAFACTVGAHAQEAFNPRLYEQLKQKASCKALNRHGGQGVPDEVHIDISGSSPDAISITEHLRVVLTPLGL